MLDVVKTSNESQNEIFSKNNASVNQGTGSERHLSSIRLSQEHSGFFNQAQLQQFLMNEFSHNSNLAMSNFGSNEIF